MFVVAVFGISVLDAARCDVSVVPKAILHVVVGSRGLLASSLPSSALVDFAFDP